VSDERPAFTMIGGAAPVCEGDACLLPAAGEATPAE
jgi:hypothetical protein